MLFVYVHFTGFFLWICLLFPHLLNMYRCLQNNPFFLKMLTWTDFISLNHSQKSDWWASVFSESCRAGAFPCFLIVLLIWKRDYFECFKIHVDCREVWWHSHWIFLCCDFFLCVCICKLEAKLHQNETDPKRTVHRMYTLSHHILNCVIRLSRKCLFFLSV